jgi:hypothetical protein
MIHPIINQDLTHFAARRYELAEATEYIEARPRLGPAQLLEANGSVLAQQLGTETKFDD